MERAKTALRKAKDKLYEAMNDYQDAMESTCSHGSEFFTLYENQIMNQMCCPKICFMCCGSESGDCNDETCTTSDNSTH